jgi:hypothetical protein
MFKWLAVGATVMVVIPRVRSSSPWRRTRLDLVFLLSFYPDWWPFPGHVCSTFARQSYTDAVLVAG